MRHSLRLREKMFRAAFWLFLASLLWLGCAVVLPAQERVREEQWVRGYHGFTALCRAMGLEPTEDIAAWRRTPPKQSVLVAFGAFDRLPVPLDGYVRRGGAVLLATDRGDRNATRLPGLFFVEGALHVSQPEAALQGFVDCPQVTELDADDPLTRGVRILATNRPGAIQVRGRFGGLSWRTPAEFPPLRKTIRSRDLRMAEPLFLVAAAETPAGGKAAAVADQSVFANQMLLFDDNAKLAMNVVAWLREPDRTTVLILDERQVIAPPSPEDVEVEFPPPTPEEVLEALRNLPPEVLVDFGNAVTATVEDENIPNELIAYLMGRISSRNYARFLLLFSTVLLVLLVARRLFSDAAYDGAAPDPSEIGRRTARDRPARERQQAARELLERFRAEVAAASDVPWKVFASRLQIGGQPRSTHRLRRALVNASRRLEPESHRYWTRRRLAALETKVREWRRLRETGALEYRTAEQR